MTPTERLGGGAPLSASARSRLELGLVPSSTSLPSRVVVVKAGGTLAGGASLCPAELVDVEFPSAGALNALLPEPIIT